MISEAFKNFVRLKDLIEHNYVCEKSFFFLLNSVSDDEEDDTTTKTRSSRQSVIELKVPSYAVSAVIGEEGTTIKKVRC